MAELRNKQLEISEPRIVLGRGTEDWVIQVTVIVAPGRTVSLEVFNLLVNRPASLFEIMEKKLDEEAYKVLTLELWFASKLADPNGVDEVNRLRLEKAVHLINVTKMFEILGRVALPGVIRTNALDLLRRTREHKLREVLSYLV